MLSLYALYKFIICHLIKIIIVVIKTYMNMYHYLYLFIYFFWYIMEYNFMVNYAFFMFFYKNFCRSAYEIYNNRMKNTYFLCVTLYNFLQVSIVKNL